METYQLTKIINAAGTYTPLGVSRSSPEVAQAAADALSEFFVMDELQDAVSSTIANWADAEAGFVTHCASAAIVIAIAASMTGNSPPKIAALPDTKGMPNRVVLPEGHAINYGHQILQDVRLAGATPVLAGNKEQCSINDLEKQLDQANVACLLLVSSRLVGGLSLDLTQAVAAAHARGIPAIIDGAAQDMRIKDLLKTKADLVLVSAHKYLASPTAGLVIGKRELVSAVRAQEKGIGRSMKASKEAIFGVLAAIRSDPAGMPFARVHLTVQPEKAGLNAERLSSKLSSADPSIRVMGYAFAESQIILELVPLDKREIEIIISTMSTILSE